MNVMVTMTKIVILYTSCCLLSGCIASRYAYSKPTDRSYVNNMVVKQPFDILWKKTIAALGESFFVINNISKESGFINVSYSGDPEKYVDCGSVFSYVKNLAGERTYDFPISRTYIRYEILSDNLYVIDSRSSLEGRINVLLTAINKNETMVKVNIRYIASVTWTSGDWKDSSSLTFDSGGKSEDGKIACLPTGELEKEILESISKE